MAEEADGEEGDSSGGSGVGAQMDEVQCDTWWMHLPVSSPYYARSLY